MTPRWDAKSDSTQAAIVDALRGVGASVTSLHRVGQGVPDLLVGYQGHTYLMEVKSPGGRLTAHEREWIRDWQGVEVAVIYRPEDALTVIGAV